MKAKHEMIDEGLINRMLLKATAEAVSVDLFVVHSVAFTGLKEFLV